MTYLTYLAQEAPKGRNVKAQGNALGKAAPITRVVGGAPAKPEVIGSDSGILQLWPEN